MVGWLELFCCNTKLGKAVLPSSNTLLRDYCSWKYLHTFTEELPKLIGREIRLQFPSLLTSSTLCLVSCFESGLVHESIASSSFWDRFQDLKGML